MGFVLGLLVLQSVTADTNAQVAARVSPGLIELFAAWATGVVRSIALIRSDISDTLPGVAIAILLVPPLCVVGLTLESQAWGQAAGALLLFVTNVAAILVTGAIVMSIYGLSRLRIKMAADKGVERKRRARAYITTAAMVLLVAGPLTYSTAKAIEDRSRIGSIQQQVELATESTRWTIVSIAARENDEIHVIVKGPPPLPDMAKVYEQMRADGMDADKISVEFIPSYTFDSTHTEAPAVSFP